MCIPSDIGNGGVGSLSSSGRPLSLFFCPTTRVHVICNDLELNMGHATRIDSPPRSWFLDRSVSSGDVWSYILFLRTTYGAFRLRRIVLRQRVFTRRRMFPHFFFLLCNGRSGRTSVDPSDDAHSSTGGKPHFQSELNRGV